MFCAPSGSSLRKDLTVEVRSREIVYTTLFFAVSCVLVFAFALVQEGRAPEDGGGRHPVDRDRVCRHAGARPHVRARAADRNAARAAAGAGAAAGDLRRQAARHPRAAGRRPSSCSCRWSRCCSRRRCFAHPFWLAAIAVDRHARLRRRRARCSPRCWCARAAATCCCRCCCIRSPFRSSLPEFAARRRCCSRSSTWRSSRFWLALLVCFDVVFVTLALWTFEPVMTD